MARTKRGNGQGSIFKRTERGCWIASWYDHAGRRHERSTRTTDRRTAERILQKITGDDALRRDGVVDPKADRFAEAERRALAEHVEDFRAMLRAKGNTKDHVQGAYGHVLRVAKLCNAKHISDLAPLTVQQAIAAIRESGRSLRTCNAVLGSVKTFASWLEREGGARENVLRHLASFNAETDRRRMRRDLTPEELSRLIDAADHGSVFRGMNGPERAMAYRLAAWTGLRADELRSLTPASFDLDAQPPTVTVAAAYSTRRRHDVQPIRPDQAEHLRPWLAGKTAGEPVLPLPDRTADMMKRDLEAASIPYMDDAGRAADFHALRHTYISIIANSGAPIKAVQELARHSTATLTFDRYTHARLHDLSAALEALPGTDGPAENETAMKATGTDDAGADGRPQQPPQPPTQRAHETTRNGATPCDDGDDAIDEADARKSLSIAADSDDVRDDASGCDNGPCWIRTSDHRIGSPVGAQERDTYIFESDQTVPIGGVRRRGRFPMVGRFNLTVQNSRYNVSYRKSDRPGR